jgi:hypothetical protein
MRQRVPQHIARLLVVMAATAHAAGAQSDSGSVKPSVGTVDGLVADSALAPLLGATVSLMGGDVHVVTGENGRFRIVGLTSGDHVLLVRRLGFDGASVPVHVDPGEMSRITVALDHVVTHLSAMDVTAFGATSMKMTEFYKRRAFGQGIFLTRGEIDQTNEINALDLLRGIPSIIVIRKGLEDGIVGSTRSGCVLQIVIDGFPVGSGGVPSPRDIAGIEVYPGPATVPLQFQNLRGARCGVVLIWTGDGR